MDGKLDAKHTVTPDEVDQCFDNKCGVNLIDDRENNRTDPPTLWFIAETNRGRLLKIIYVYRDGNIYLKSAYEPGQVEIDIYEREGK
ncbi:ADP-ribosyl-(dinitrogen reductase) hydrolase [Noviherbaspirillum sedimenti]|uniref:ADP-ribosyl-(Dinitrogen reductase) hydrolase n=1 Tax=Noviherbaspirillum sedimenti TaxID=2320865 RepID=A0A3A3G8Q9_9BURK|nr:ADP-ribosyl-(dinitrogen reductase) hydrolase [Noviherbaspirillum sedimenti]